MVARRPPRPGRHRPPRDGRMLRARRRTTDRMLRAHRRTTDRTRSAPLLSLALSANHPLGDDAFPTRPDGGRVCGKMDRKNLRPDNIRDHVGEILKFRGTIYNCGTSDVRARPDYGQRDKDVIRQWWFGVFFPTKLIVIFEYFIPFHHSQMWQNTLHSKSLKLLSLSIQYAS